MCVFQQFTECHADDADHWAIADQDQESSRRTFILLDLSSGPIHWCGYITDTIQAPSPNLSPHQVS